MRQIDAGMGPSKLTAFTAETCGCSRRNSRDVLAKVHKDWLDSCYGSEEVDQRDLLFQQVVRLERIARKAENAGQFSAAVGAITTLNRMMALGPDQKGFSRSQDAFPPILIWISLSMLHIAPRQRHKGHVATATKRSPRFYGAHLIQAMELGLGLCRSCDDFVVLERFTICTSE